jgi:hypothetical protein
MEHKKTYIALGITISGLLVVFGLVVAHNKRADSSLLGMCPNDHMLCPDGSMIPRSGPKCQFGVCSQASITSTTTEAAAMSTSSLYSTNPVTPETSVEAVDIPGTQSSSNLFTKITSAIGDAVGSGAAAIKTTISSGLSNTKTTANTEVPLNNSPEQKNNQQVPAPENNSPPPPPPPVFEQNKYTVKDGNIIDNTDNSVVYTLPPSVSNSVGSGGGDGWESHTVNVVAVGDVPPVLNAIPVNGLPGKYYLSENSFGTEGDCQFSNKIFILDTHTNEATLMYEENNNTLSKDDPRACTSEIFLLDTEAEKLILKYHTLNTNTLCDSQWSEPEKTYYLDVTNLAAGMSKYTISKARYDAAEQEETICRDKL